MKTMRRRAVNLINNFNGAKVEIGSIPYYY